MFKRIFLSAALLLFVAATAYAQNDSISKGLLIVEDFYTETTALMSPFKSLPEADSFNELSVEKTNQAAAEIRSLRWVETPGMRRYNRVYNVVDSYTADQIESMKGFAQNVPAARARVDEAIARLTTFKESKLNELKDSLKVETYEGKKIKPVPIIDRSPREKDNNGGSGMWFR